MADDSRSSNSSDSDSESGSRPPTPKATTSSCQNVFKNDGSFMEMFKKMQDQQKGGKTPSAAKNSVVNRIPNVKVENESSDSSQSSESCNSKKSTFGLVRCYQFDIFLMII